MFGVAGSAVAGLTPMRFAELDVPDPVREGIRAAGFTVATPIQEAALPVALKGKDVAGQAQTGTGKTAAFLIATFTRLLRTRPAGPRPRGAPRALIIAPTRELVVQIDADARLLGQFTGLRTQLVFGGVDYNKQRDALGEPVDLLIGTPGRLIDYLKQRVWTTSHVEVLILDEADRMFDMGFIADIRWILRRLPPPEARQSFLFSATLSFRVLELTYEFMNNPAQITVSRRPGHGGRVEQILYHVGRHEKFGLLLGLLRAEQGSRILIFTNTREEAQRLVERLERNGHLARALTGDLDQRQRLRTLEEFKDGTLPILVATDVASRGLHIPDVTHVYNWDLPQDAEDYVHRIGRTARAGRAGQGDQPGGRGGGLLARGGRAVHRPEDPRGVGRRRAVPAGDPADRRGAPAVGRAREAAGRHGGRGPRPAGPAAARPAARRTRPGATARRPPGAERVDRGEAGRGAASPAPPPAGRRPGTAPGPAAPRPASEPAARTSLRSARGACARRSPRCGARRGRIRSPRPR